MLLYRTKTNATGFLARVDGVILYHSQEFVHPIFLYFRLDYD